MEIDGNKIQELKKKAIDADLSLSAFLSHAGTIVKLEDLKKQINI